ncbi:MAG: methyltransferase, TIGR04325 family [Undibacterium sp.]|uniref:methyltransferase, TIGR04325 family n=1 Tax=Undibacterium sp. TaxID=1914977 RepID=UPI00271B95DE|nr:methyltransferase, TIGR04325 family [Undibacterium sp.]MDO8652465.1 methyltransferase, TIGR04325 family [Undibacterium sp.]
MSIKTIARDWLPPAVVRVIGRLRSGGIRFNGNYPTWEEAAAECTGYDDAPILTKVLESTLKVKRGEAAYERDSVLFECIEYVWPVTAAIMWVAAQSGGRLNVLDFGGALGSSYFQNRAFLASLPEVRWSVIEQAHYVSAGREHIQDNTLRFYTSVDDCLAENKPNAILLSSVLEYLPESISYYLDIVGKSKAEIIIVDRSPVAFDQVEKITVQKVPRQIYKATLPCRLISSKRLIDLLKALNYELVIQYPSIGGSGSNFSYQGFIFKRIDRGMSPV